MFKKLNKIFSDIPGYIFRCLRKTRIKISLFWGTATTIVICYLKNVELGKGCKFYGNPKIHRNPHCKIKIGKNCIFRSDITNNIGINKKCILLARGFNSSIQIGNNSAFNGSVISAASNVVIGNNVLCGYNVLITDYDAHPVDPELRRTHTGERVSKPILIEDNVWLGANTTVIKGVRIGKNSVIGANSHVVKDVPSNVIAGGNPCKVIKNIY
jgi:acetyltransferase-like isoleucine patch superfamily enzyme